NNCCAGARATSLPVIAMRPCAPDETRALDRQRRLIDKLDFLSFIESIGREFQAKVLNFRSVPPCARLSPQRRKEAGVSAQMRPVLRIIPPDRRFILSAVLPAEDQV